MSSLTEDLAFSAKSFGALGREPDSSLPSFDPVAYSREVWAPSSPLAHATGAHPLVARGFTSVATGILTQPAEVHGRWVGTDRGAGIGTPLNVVALGPAVTALSTVVQGPRIDQFLASADQPPRLEWLNPVLRRVGDLLSLPSNWDTYGAPPTRPEEARRMLGLLLELLRPSTPPPALVPAGSGGMQAEWHRAGLDIEILVAGSDEDGLYICDRKSGSEWEGDPRAGFRQFGLARRLEGVATSVGR